MAGSLVGGIVNGIYTKTDASTEATAKASSTTSTSKTAASGDSGYDQEMFLQLLIAEMQYQDPLEPTDNSEYVTQLASFTTIDAIQQVQADMQTIQANSLVGKYVIVNDNNEYFSGQVDYVTTDSDGTLQIAVNDKLYTIDKIDSVVNEKYYNAVIAAETFTDIVGALPTLSDITKEDAESIASARNVYNAMDSYTQGYVNAGALSNLTAYEKRVAELLKAAEQATSADSEDNSETADDATTETVASASVAEAEETEIETESESETIGATEETAVD